MFWEVPDLAWPLPAGDTGYHPAHLDGQHYVRLALQHLHGLAVADVIEPDTVGRQDLVPHFDAILLSQPTMVHSGDRRVWLDKTLACLPPPSPDPLHLAMGVPTYTPWASSD